MPGCDQAQPRRRRPAAHRQKGGACEIRSAAWVNCRKTMAGSVYAFWQGSREAFGETLPAAFPTHSGCYKPRRYRPLTVYNGARRGSGFMSLRRAVSPCASFRCAPAAASAQFQPAPAPPQQEPPCVKEFFKLRDDAEKKAAGDQGRRTSARLRRREACQLFSAFVAAQSKMLKYATENATWCGIPTQVMENLKQGDRQDVRDPYQSLSGRRGAAASSRAQA